MNPISGSNDPTGGLIPLRDALTQALGGAPPPSASPLVAGMAHNLPTVLNDTEPIHRQIEPDFLMFERQASPQVDRPGEPVTPREAESNAEVERIIDLMRRYPWAFGIPETA